MKILVLTHTNEGGAVPQAALEVVTCARALGGDVAIGIFGQGAAASIGTIAVENDAVAQPRAASDFAAAAAIVAAAGAELILAPQTSRMARISPALAVQCGGVCDTHVTSVLPGGSATRWFYRQRIEGVFTRDARPWFVMIESGCYPPATAEPAAAVNALDVAVASRTTHEGYAATQAGEQTIRPDAEMLFVAGAGWTKKQKDGTVHATDASDLILGFVRSARSSLGSSKSLVDLSSEGQSVLPFLTHLHQVGQTGSTPRHRKGLATCCHGEEPHVVGWRFIHERRAVNLDANCGWARGKADVLYVADAFEVMREVNRLLS